MSANSLPSKGGRALEHTRPDEPILHQRPSPPPLGEPAAAKRASPQGHAAWVAWIDGDTETREQLQDEIDRVLEHGGGHGDHTVAERIARARLHLGP